MEAATNCAGVDDIPGWVCQAMERPQVRGAGSYRNQQVDEPHRDGEKGGRLWWQARRERALRVRVWQLCTRQPERTAYRGYPAFGGCFASG